MIRLKSLLTEISLGGVQPYATQFTWSPEGQGVFECNIDADGHRIVFSMVLTATRMGREYAFAMLAQDRSKEGFTVAHHRSEARGQINYLRLLSTAAEAILDFVSVHAPVAVDVTGSDTRSQEKDLQKTRIYRGLLSANAARLAQAGYTVLDRTGKLYIVRRSSADSSGIVD